MSALCGILGKRDENAVRAMAAAMKHRGAACHVLEGDAFIVAGSTPPGKGPCLVDGAVRDTEGTVLNPDALRAHCIASNDAARLRLQGAFAAVVCWDGGRRWWLMRDRLGVKPLYYCLVNDTVVFASELKGLLASGLMAKHLNLASVDRYLTLRCVPGPETIFQGIRRVQPGHVLEYWDGKLSETLYNRVDLHVEPVKRKAAAERLRAALERAVNRTAAENVLWSAGMDCAALAALKPGLKPLFVALRTAWQDEARLAKSAARSMRLPLETRRGRPFDEETFLKAVYHLDEPIADPSVFPLWQILEQAGRVAGSFLTGHGADELLGGYPRYHFLQKTRGARRRMPAGLLMGIRPALPPNAFLRRGARYLSSGHDNLEGYMSLLSVFDHDERAELYTDAMKAAIHEKGGSLAVIQSHFCDVDLTRDLLSLDLNVGLPDLLLTECERMAAAHGVELEFPYLDDDLVDFAVTLPANVKFGARSKSLLRHAMKGILPGRVRIRARRGFRVPQGGQAVRVIEAMARQTITQERVEASGLFKWPVVEQVVRSATHNVYRRRQFWALLMFFAWHRAYMET